MWRKKQFLRLVEEVRTNGIAYSKTSTDFSRCRRFDGHPELVAAIEEFREAIQYSIPKEVLPVTHFHDKLKQLVEQKARDVPDLPQASTDRIAAVLARTASAQEQSHGSIQQSMGLNAEVVHEQEAEEEQEQEAEQEEQRVSLFNRDDEQQLPWHVSGLARPPATASNFYACNQFRSHPQQPLIDVSPTYQISDNYFKLRWNGIGDRKLKNCVVFVEWRALAEQATAGEATEQQPTAIATTHQDGGVWFSVVSLAESETIRWLVHHSKSVRSTYQFALRFVATGAVMD